MIKELNVVQIIIEILYKRVSIIVLDKNYFTFFMEIELDESPSAMFFVFFL
jgi:hypothetical protein